MTKVIRTFHDYVKCLKSVDTVGVDEGVLFSFTAESVIFRQKR